MLLRVDVRTLRSAAGREYELFVWHPSAPAPAAGFPVLYVLDANAIFGTVVEAIRMRSARPDVTGVTPAVVVGIGYRTEEPYDRARRRYDYTSLPSPAPGPQADSAAGLSSPETGGADAFQDFLEHTVRTEIARRVPIDPGRQAIFGHSLAGFFVLRMMLRNPSAFQGYIAASPSIWWDREGLMDAIQPLGGWLRRSHGILRAHIGVGELEQKLAPWEIDGAGAEEKAARRRSRRMVDNARELAEGLAALGSPRLRVRFDEYADEDHASAVLRTLSRGLPYVLTGHDPAALRG